MNGYRSGKLKTDIEAWVDRERLHLLDLTMRLIRISSENRPPLGNELPVQEMLEFELRQSGFETERYDLSEVPGLTEHTAYWPGRNYENRPNLIARKSGSGSGRSLLFAVHADVVPGLAGKYPPFSPVIEDGKLYGRGSNDMKGGIAACMTAFRYIQGNGLRLYGDLMFESVVDEEMGGANGTLAGRIRGDLADAVIVPEPTNMKVCASHLGGVTWRITIKGKGGMGFGGEALQNPNYAMARIIREIELYHEECRGVIAHRTASGEVLTPNVVLSYLRGGDFEPGMADGIPETCTAEVWVECVPGQKLEDLRKSFQERIRQLCEWPEMNRYQVEWEQITRFLPGSEAKTDLTGMLVSLVHSQCNMPEQSYMAPFACDAFVFNEYSSSPAVILGPIGENAHAADEFVDIDSLLDLTKVYIRSIIDWCGADL